MGGLKQDYWRNYVDGNWEDGGAGRLTVENPGTGEPLAEIALADAADIDRAVKAALACHESGVLSSMRPVERGRMVRGMGDYLLANREEIAEMLTLESGKPWSRPTARHAISNITAIRRKPSKGVRSRLAATISISPYTSRSVFRPRSFPGTTRWK